MSTNTTFNFETSHVQEELTSGSFVNSATVLIAAGPPFIDRINLSAQGIRLYNQGSTDYESIATQGTINNIPVYPLGVVENANLSQARQLQRLFEIGSKRSYFVAGRTIGSITLARTLFYGPSLLKILYAYASKDRFPNADYWVTMLAGADIDASMDPDNKIDNMPGYGDLLINLDSDLFDVPFGLMFYLESASNKPYGAFYLEEAHINAHQMNISSSSTLVAEGVTIQYDQLLPLDIGAVSAIA